MIDPNRRQSGAVGCRAVSVSQMAGRSLGSELSSRALPQTAQVPSAHPDCPPEEQVSKAWTAKESQDDGLDPKVEATPQEWRCYCGEGGNKAALIGCTRSPHFAFFLIPLFGVFVPRRFSLAMPFARQASRG